MIPRLWAYQRLPFSVCADGGEWHTRGAEDRPFVVLGRVPLRYAIGEHISLDLVSAKLYSVPSPLHCDEKFRSVV